MTSRLFLRLLSTLAVCCAALAAGAADAPPSFDAWLERFTLDWVRRQPGATTGKGYFPAAEQDQLDRELTPVTEKFARELAAVAQHGLGELQQFDPAKLTASQRVSAAVLKWELEQAVGDVKFWDYFYPFNQIIGAQSGIVLFLDNSHPIQNVRDAENYLARIEKIPAMLDDLIAETRVREQRRGIRAPKFILEATIAQMERLIEPAPADFILVSSLARRAGEAKDFPAADRARLVAATTAEVERALYPAYRRAIALLREQLARAGDTAGLSQFSGGAEAYAWYLRKYTTTDYTPEQVHELGLKHVAEIEREMDTILRQLGLTEGSIATRLAQLLAREQPPGTEEEGRAYMLATYEKTIRDAERRCETLFDLRPKAPVIVKREPAFTERSTAPHYTEPARDGSRPGIFWATLPAPPFPVIALRSLTYHEAVPGHHFQFALQLEMTDLPVFRRDAIFGFAAAYGEGWALYAEKLAAEQGWYEGDLVGRLGQLASARFRAKRLVVDTGLHVKGWTRQQAIDYGMGVAETERYVVWPGQACSYKVGELKILELREKARRALGEKFSLKEFHNVVLRTGGVPLAVLEQVVDDWVAGKK